MVSDVSSCWKVDVGDNLLSNPWVRLFKRDLRISQLTQRTRDRLLCMYTYARPFQDNSWAWKNPSHRWIIDFIPCRQGTSKQHLEKGMTHLPAKSTEPTGTISTRVYVRKWRQKVKNNDKKESQEKYLISTNRLQRRRGATKNQATKLEWVMVVMMQRSWSLLLVSEVNFVLILDIRKWSLVVQNFMSLPQSKLIIVGIDYIFFFFTGISVLSGAWRQKQRLGR